MKPLVILRPEPGASDTVAAARALGLDAYACPLFRVGPIAWAFDATIPYDAVFVTSANALRHGGEHLGALHGFPLLAVGAATAEAARAAGFTDIVTGESDGAALAELAAALGYHHLLHLAGDPHTQITHPPLIFDVKITYQTIEIEELQYFFRRLERPCVTLVHSPRAGRRLAALMPLDARANTAIVAISEKAALAVGEGWASTSWPSLPLAAAMLDLALPLCRAG